jgi:hypothetical protein
MKKLFLLPGFGEDGFCFDEIRSGFEKYEVIDIDYRPVLNRFVFPFITRYQFALQLIKYYNINPHDKLIGHSMGGYFSFQIREIQGNDICMVGAFSDPKKLIHFMPKFPRFSQLMAISGIIKTDYTKQNLTVRSKDEKIRKALTKAIDNFKTFSNIQLAKMSEMCYVDEIPSSKPNPLRIHDKGDRVVAPPDEPYVQIGGGHFPIQVFPQETLEMMKDFLK